MKMQRKITNEERTMIHKGIVLNYAGKIEGNTIYKDELTDTYYCRSNNDNFTKSEHIKHVVQYGW